MPYVVRYDAVAGKSGVQREAPQQHVHLVSRVHPYPTDSAYTCAGVRGAAPVATGAAGGPASNR